MNSFKPLNGFSTLLLSAALAMACTAVGCNAEVVPQSGDDAAFRAGEGGNAIEDPNDDPGLEIDEGPESNAGVEGPVTITQPQLGQLFAAGAVGAKLQTQKTAGYVGESVTDSAAAKIATLTGESIQTQGQSGGEVRGTTDNYRFLVAPGRDQLLIQHASKLFSDVPAAQQVGETQILAAAQADLNAIGLSLGEGQTLKVDRLMRASSDDPDNPELAAYKVFVGLEIDGRPVEGPRAVLSYFTDGELHKVSASWPAIDSAGGPGPLPSAGAILSAVYSKLAAHPLGAETNPIEADAGLTVDGGTLRHVVQVRGLLDNGDGQGRLGQLDVMF